jgi:plasmid stabilization system protein ParE
MMEYVLGTGAELDLDEIWEYIANDSIEAADRWIAKLFDAFEKLARTPGMGHKREDLTAYPVLFWPVGAYLIIYRVQNEFLEIVAVRKRNEITFTTTFWICYLVGYGQRCPSRPILCWHVAAS